ncbi:hypothetical protein GOP47_0024309 [Adiantum capillus-veneris]|uniref:JmjC domain-containing protein n=1 Tax=Adiantum capillus-veneris TaxID=13818 RepID=A0A9D4Z3K2_ADICA|nr:hypothetical protein GOP47_0024309 [Adiantum capillus-veneris]
MKDDIEKMQEMKQVAECSTREFTDQKRVNMTVADYITYWKRHNSYKQDLDCAGSFLYLKDWHFVKDYPEYGPYSTPIFFMDDWLNLYLEHYQLHANEGEVETPGCLSDYRFVYMGPKDVLRSYSWSSNICGKKLWHLLPPSETHLIFDRHMRSSVYNIYGDISVEEFPNFHKAGWLECTQEKGQILFVPSKWYHQVTNLEDTISINHNWINGYNLHWVWELILTDYKETRASIEDIRLIADDFEELCQRNLAENSVADLELLGERCQGGVHIHVEWTDGNFDVSSSFDKSTSSRCLDADAIFQQYDIFCNVITDVIKLEDALPEM